MSMFNTYWVIEIFRGGTWNPSNDCAYSGQIPLYSAKLWADEKRAVRIVEYGDEPAHVVAEWNSEGERIV